jgi:hypothetical protein
MQNQATSTLFVAQLLARIIGGEHKRVASDGSICQIQPDSSDWLPQYTGYIEITSGSAALYEFIVHTEEALAMLRALVAHMKSGGRVDIEEIKGDSLDPYRELRLGGDDSEITGGEHGIVIFNRFYLMPDEAGVMLEALIECKRQQRKRAWESR